MIKNKSTVSIEAELKYFCQTFLEAIGEYDREGIEMTPERFSKAWSYYTSGYSADLSKLMTSFKDGADNYDEMVLVKDIPVFSHCEHHLAPFFGVAHIAYIPNGRILGLSKFVRVVDAFMRRLQVQERLTTQIANAFDHYLAPAGVAVVIECEHTCMIGRGVKVAGSKTITSALRGAFKTQSETRAEFMGLIR